MQRIGAVRWDGIGRSGHRGKDANARTPCQPGGSRFAFRELYEFLEDEAYPYAIGLKDNPVLEREIEQLLIRLPIRASGTPDVRYQYFESRAAS